MISEFTASLPNLAIKTQWLADGTYIADGSSSLRDLNLPIDSPKTLNGLLIEILENISDNNVSIKIDDIVIEIIQVDDQIIKTVRIRQTNA